MQAPQSRGAGPLNQNHILNQAGQEEPAHTGGRLVINVVSGCPHPADQSRKKGKSFARSIKHADFECRSNLEDRSPTKRQRTIINDIMFRNRHADRVGTPITDPLVISAQVGHAWMKKILIDSGSSMNIIFKQANDQMEMEGKDLNPCQLHIHGFDGSANKPIGMVEMPVELETGERWRVRDLQFVVLYIDSSYNAFLGRSTLVEFRAVIASWCLTLKFPTANGVGAVQGVQGDQADLRAVMYRNRVPRLHNVKIRPQTFELGDFVHKRIYSIHSHMKPTWEAPYVIEQKLENGTFKLTTVGGPTLSEAWNSENLGHCCT